MELEAIVMNIRSKGIYATLEEPAFTKEQKKYTKYCKLNTHLVTARINLYE
jgi:hypothetical protein